MFINILVICFFEYSSAYKNANDSIESQFTIMSKEISEAIITDDIYTLYTVIEEVSNNIDHIDNIIVFNEFNGYITDAKVRKKAPEKSDRFIKIDKKISARGHKLVGHITFYISKESILKSILKNVSFLIVINTLILIIGAVAGMYISRMLTRPLFTLSDQISKLDVLRLPYKITLPEYSSRETLGLKIVIEELSANLKDSLDKISQQQKDMARSERLAYIGTMSAGLAHELKNPIMSINLILDSMASENEDNEQFNEDYRMIKSQAEKLVYRIDEFLNYSKPVMLENKMFKLFDLLAEMKRQTYSVKLSGMDLRIDAEDDIILQSDMGKIIQIFEILLNNSREAGADKVIIKTTIDDNTICFTYKDNGPGFSEADVSKVMLPFYSTKRSGAGLGLAICSTILDAMGGAIEITARNKGALIKVCIPTELS